jgi:hypothetical protein
MKEDDNNWPMPDRVGKQELEIKMNGEHICFNTTKLGSVLQVQQSKDPDGLRIFYYLVQVRTAGGWGGGTGMVEDQCKGLRAYGWGVGRGCDAQLHTYQPFELQLLVAGQRFCSCLGRLTRAQVA